MKSQTVTHISTASGPTRQHSLASFWQHTQGEWINKKIDIKAYFYTVWLWPLCGGKQTAVTVALMLSDRLWARAAGGVIAAEKARQGCCRRRLEQPGLRAPAPGQRRATLVGPPTPPLSQPWSTVPRPEAYRPWQSVSVSNTSVCSDQRPWGQQAPCDQPLASTSSDDYGMFTMIMK